jgi:hypothetical protein
MKKEPRQVNLAKAIGYVLWVLTALITLGTALAFRAILMKLYVLLLPSPWTINAADKILGLLLILGWIIFVLLCERYYQRGAEQGLLWRRFSIIVVPCLIILGLSYVFGLIAV